MRWFAVGSQAKTWLSWVRTGHERRPRSFYLIPPPFAAHAERTSLHKTAVDFASQEFYYKFQETLAEEVPAVFLYYPYLYVIDRK